MEPGAAWGKRGILRGLEKHVSHTTPMYPIRDAGRDGPPRLEVHAHARDRLRICYVWRARHTIS